MNPDWILFLDADEIFEYSMTEKIKYLINNDDVDVYCFRVFNHYEAATKNEL